MAFTSVIRPAVAALLLGGCTATGLAVEDPNPDIQQEVWNIASRYDTSFKAGGMAGVTQEIESCYQSATVPVTKIWALRDCLILDYTGFYTDMKVGRRLNHISLPYFAPETFAARTTRYAKMDGFTSPAQLSNYFKDTEDLVQIDLAQLNQGPIVVNRPLQRPAVKPDFPTCWNVGLVGCYKDTKP